MKYFVLSITLFSDTHGWATKDVLKYRNCTSTYIETCKLHFTYHLYSVAMTYAMTLRTRQFNSVLDDETETSVLNKCLCVLEDWRKAVDTKHNKLPNNTAQRAGKEITKRHRTKTKGRKGDYQTTPYEDKGPERRLPNDTVQRQKAGKQIT